MIIYKDRSIYEQLLSKLEEFEPSSKFSQFSGIEKWDELRQHSDNYFKLYNIIKNYRNDLSYIHNTLYEIINRLSKNLEFIKTDYDRYKHNCKFYNLRLNILECRLQHESGGQYHHNYFSTRDLPKFGCRYGHIDNLMHMKNGSPDFVAESKFGNEWEIKMMTGNKITFTHTQLEKFNKNCNVLIYRKIEPNSYIHRLNHVGAEFHNHIKFGDVYDVLLEKKSYFSHKVGDRLYDNIPIIYQIEVEDSLESAKSIIKNRYIQEEAQNS